MQKIRDTVKAVAAKNARKPLHIHCAVQICINYVEICVYIYVIMKDCSLPPIHVRSTTFSSWSKRVIICTCPCSSKYCILGTEAPGLAWRIFKIYLEYMFYHGWKPDQTPERQKEQIHGNWYVLISRMCTWPVNVWTMLRPMAQC